MTLALTLLIGLVVVLLLFAVFVIGQYNGLITLRNRYQNAYAQIDVQLKRRYDLIPNLVETAKGYMAHEKGTLEAVIQARNTAVSAGQKAAAQPGDPSAMGPLLAAEAGLTGALGRLFALSEAYPDLKANTTMNSLMEELTSTENKVSFARQAYNDVVMTYNTKREVFPTNIVAGIFNFAAATLFQVESEEEKAAPKVQF